MTTNDLRAQLLKILRLALESPYAGEREKALGLLLPRLRQSGLTLRDLDARFGQHAGENELRERARLRFRFEVTLRSAEEALLYLTLVRRLGPPGSEGEYLAGHHLRCFTDADTKVRVTELLAGHQAELASRLVAAQRQAQREYQARREVLFRQAVQELAEQLSE